MDTSQMLLTIVLSLTGLLLCIVGIQLVFILREIRKTIKRTNKILDSYNANPEELARMIRHIQSKPAVRDQRATHFELPVDQAPVIASMPPPDKQLDTVIEKMKTMTDDKRQLKRFFVKSGKTDIRK